MGGSRIIDNGGAGGTRPGASPTARGRGQRDRLIQAMIELAAERGQREVTIAGISSQAGVSSETFYKQFPDKEACMVAAYRESASRVLNATTQATRELQLANERSEETLRGVLESLMFSIQLEPDAARVLFVEGLSGGRRMREESLRVLERMITGTEAAIESVAPTEGPIELPAIALVGAVRNVVSRCLRAHNEDRLPRIVAPFAEWILSYQLPSGRLRWRTELSDAAAGQQQRESLLGAFDRPRLPRGRHGLPPGEVIRSQRTRIIAATAEMTMVKGYASTTVADIVAAAGVARDAFYEHFRDKEHAFLEAQQHPTQYILDRCAEAYFQAPDWPHRLWNHLETLLRLIAENPTISHLRLVECYAAGPAAIRRAEEITSAFNIFLEEGYLYAPGAATRPRLFSEAITGAMFEVIRSHAARGETARLPATLPQLTYLGLAPFAGASKAIDLVEEIARETSTAYA